MAGSRSLGDNLCDSARLISHIEINVGSTFFTTFSTRLFADTLSPTTR
jgi:hypothetical protein